MDKINYGTNLKHYLKIRDSVTSNPELISTCVVKPYQIPFNQPSFLWDTSLVDEAILPLVNDQNKNMLIMIPSLEKVHNAVFNMKKDSASGLDGLEPFFFQNYWSIIKDDVYPAILQYFKEGWIIPTYNSNILVLIHKVPDVDTIEHFRPIALSNFKHKIITKFIADKLDKIMSHIIYRD